MSGKESRSRPLGAVHPPSHPLFPPPTPSRRRRPGPGTARISPCFSGTRCILGAWCSVSSRMHHTPSHLPAAAAASLPCPPPPPPPTFSLLPPARGCPRARERQEGGKEVTAPGNTPCLPSCSRS